MKPLAPIAPIVRPDLLKLARAVEDALSGVLWKDDSQVVVEVLRKRYDEPMGCVVTVKEFARSSDAVQMKPNLLADTTMRVSHS